MILLDARVTDQIATRRLRIVKYRGSAHGTNEYPFLIDEQGFTVLPITGINLNYAVSRQTVSTGIPSLDAMFAAKGFFRGGSLLVSGAAGTGKSSIAAHFIDAACRRGERCIYFAFEESADQIMRNMLSIGIDLRQWVTKGVLRFDASRPSSLGMEVHLSSMIRLVDQFKPQVVVLDPVTSFSAAGTELDARAMLMRLVDLLKTRQITALFTSLTSAGDSAEQSEVGISSLINSWLVLHNVVQSGERARTLSVVKSRGMKHSNQARELVLTDHGAELADVFVGPDGTILTGSARMAQEAADLATAAALQQDIARKQAALARKRKALEARIAEMQAELALEAEDVGMTIAQQASTASEPADRPHHAGKPARTGRRRAEGPSQWRHAMKPAPPRSTRTARKQLAVPTKEWNLCLYVAGQSPRSLDALSNLKKLCETHLAGKYRIEVVDLLQNPQLSRDDQIVAIPTLVRKLPPPLQKDHRRSVEHRTHAGGSATEAGPVAGCEGVMKKPAAKRTQGGATATAPGRYRLRLFISGATPRSTQAIANIKEIGKTRLHGNYELEVIDAYQQAELVRDQQIVVLPTLVKSLPLPLRRMVGDLSDEDRVLIGLGVVPEESTDTEASR